MKKIVTVIILTLQILTAAAQCRATFRLVDVIATSMGGQTGCWDTALNFGPVIYIEADTQYHYWSGTMQVQTTSGKCLTPFAVGTANWGNIFGIDSSGSCTKAVTLQPVGMGWSPYTGTWSGAMAAAYFTKAKTASNPSWQVWPYHSRLYVSGSFWLGRTPADPAGCTAAVTFIVDPCFPPLALHEPAADSSAVGQHRPYSVGAGWLDIRESIDFLMANMEGRTMAEGKGPAFIGGIATGIYSLLLEGENKPRKIYIP